MAFSIALLIVVILLVLLFVVRSRSRRGSPESAGPSSMGRIGNRPQLRFANAAMGRALVRDEGDLHAVLVKENMGHLIGRPYRHGETSDGGYVIYW